MYLFFMLFSRYGFSGFVGYNKSMKQRLSSKEAKAMMGFVGTAVMLGLADLEDFIEVMIEVDEHAITLEADQIDYLNYILNHVND
jgi:hypothetical protein